MSPITISNPPQIRVSIEDEFAMNGLRSGFDLSGLLPLYIYVRDNINQIAQNKDLEFSIGSGTFIYKVSRDTIKIIDAKDLNSQNSIFGNIRISPREHFWVSYIKRGFEFSGLLPLYSYVKNNIKQLENKKDMEFTIGTSTIVYEVRNNSEIHLITGWNGSRK
ncbi:hypothetical protein ACOTWR_11660 [Aliarcobacter butzleri]|uniref:hypothetical protein n=1 Tax=Aliarcobacter butzleri TaxID=28197 RepID=UPI0021B46F9A|nr:hypothetical protein [Aliarcobacter butzleri]MCT7563336.1 hypothetical protein [Aliarcobacter butzleri]MCT7580222.1 hypothetical protein [Aliarcobacter butzleri]MCT7647520.1 hypothetical protein [Aliarcobacter butzleri]